MGLPIMTICSTCQGVISQANHRVVNDQDYLTKLTKSSLRKIYIIQVKPKLSIFLDLLEDIGVEPLQKMFNIDLSGFNFAPFYGCYLIRPSDAQGMTKNPKKNIH